MADTVRGIDWIARSRGRNVVFAEGSSRIGQPPVVNRSVKSEQTGGKLLDPVLRAQLERHWEYAGKDEDIAHEIYADDAVLEFPQGGERYEGVENFREWRRSYPAEVAFKIRRLDRWGDLVVAELFISYDGGPPMYTVNLIELNADDKIVHERIYIMEGWEAPEWRAQWRSDSSADSVTWE